MKETFLKLGEYGAAGMYEELDRSLFYRKSLGMRRYYEHCELQHYHGELLYPSGKYSESMRIHPHYLDGMTVDLDEFSKIAPSAAEAFAADFNKYHSSVPCEHAVAGNMYTHSIPNYERILKEGLLSYLARIETIKDIDLRDGLMHLVRGIETYIRRICTYLTACGAESRLIHALKKVPLYPAENIYEAVVCWNFIMYLDNCDNLGCIDSGLQPYYNGEDITDLLRNLYDNLDANDGYSMALHTNYSELTLMCLEASKGKRRPMIELFVNENTPDEVWKKAFEVIRTSNGQPAFYNGNILLNGLQKKFPNISESDIEKFCGGGCTEAMVAGYSNVGSLDAGINLLLILESTIKTELKSSNTFENFYEKYIKEVERVVSHICGEISKSQKNRAKYNPLPMRTLLIDDCIDNGMEYNNGGARYKWSIINFAGMINVIDSLLVIKAFVFESNMYSPAEFIEKLNNNDREFLKKARNHSVSFGNDNPEANAFSNRLSSEIFAMLNDKTPYLGGGFLPASIQFMSQVYAGKNIGASPDGRESGAPLCDSLAAIFGKDTKGPTALLNSVTSLDLKRALGVPVLNFNINHDFKNDILKALILGYMKNGGIQMQISCVSRQMLEDAYKNPDMHKNLIVRVGGYSEYFYKLDDELKRMVIERTIQSEV